MENGPFEDVFPIKHGDIPASYVSLPKGIFLVCVCVCVRFLFHCITDLLHPTHNLFT